AADRGGGPSDPSGRPARRGRSRRPPAGRGRPAPDRALADDRRTPSAEARTGGPGKRPRARAHARWRSRPGACPGALPRSAPAQRLRRTDRPSPRASRARRGRSQVVIREARKSDVPAVMPLFRRYCEFYEASPPDEGLERMARAIIAAPDDEAFLLVAEDEGVGGIVGFSACGWKWSSLRGARIVVLEDLFVAERARARAHADALIEA